MKKLLLLLICISLLLVIPNIKAEIFQVDIDHESDEIGEVDYGVILNTYELRIATDSIDPLIISNFNNDTLVFNSNPLVSVPGEIQVYDWTPTKFSGERTFNLGEDTFTINVLSRVDEFFLLTARDIRVTDVTVVLNMELDFDGATFQYQDFDYEGTGDNEGFTGHIDMNNVLENIDFDIRVEDDGTMTINSVSIIDPTGIVRFALDEAGVTETIEQINNAPSLLQPYINDVFTYPFTTGARSVKEGYNYKIMSNSFDDDIENTVRGLVGDGINLVAPVSLVDYIEEHTGYDISLIELTFDFSGVNLDANGDYEATVHYTDDIGNEGEITLPTTVYLLRHIVPAPGPKPPADTGGGGGGGGYYSERTDFSATGTKDFSAGAKGRLNFNIPGDDSNHLLRVDRINDDGTVDFTVQSEPKFLTLSTGQDTNVDVNDDGTEDINVLLNSVLDRKAYFTVTYLQSAPGEVTGPGGEGTPEGETGGTEPPGVTGAAVTGAATGLSSATKGISIVLVIVAIGIGLFFITRKRKK